MNIKNQNKIKKEIKIIDKKITKLKEKNIKMWIEVKKFGNGNINTGQFEDNEKEIEKLKYQKKKIESKSREELWIPEKIFCALCKCETRNLGFEEKGFVKVWIDKKEYKYEYRCNKVGCLKGIKKENIEERLKGVRSLSGKDEIIKELERLEKKFQKIVNTTKDPKEKKQVLLEIKKIREDIAFWKKD